MEELNKQQKQSESFEEQAPPQQDETPDLPVIIVEQVDTCQSVSSRVTFVCVVRTFLHRDISTDLFMFYRSRIRITLNTITIVQSSLCFIAIDKKRLLHMHVEE